jgi:hypothetical protein
MGEVGFRTPAMGPIEVRATGAAASGVPKEHIRVSERRIENRFWPKHQRQRTLRLAAKM